MSRIADCPACWTGDHNRHVGPWNVREGLIGGTVCCCTGDCAERAERNISRLLGSMRPHAESGANDG